MPLFYDLATFYLFQGRLEAFVKRLWIKYILLYYYYYQYYFQRCPFELNFFFSLTDKLEESRHYGSYQGYHHHEHHWGPYFEGDVGDPEGAMQVTAHVGAEALLNCRVGMLKDKTVSLKYFIIISALGRPFLDRGCLLRPTTVSIGSGLDPP